MPRRYMPALPRYVQPRRFDFSSVADGEARCCPRRCPPWRIQRAHAPDPDDLMSRAGVARLAILMFVFASDEPAADCPAALFMILFA